MKYKGFTYIPAPKTAWDSLSMQKKSEMMKVAVRNGITDLKTIREKFNEFAEGGSIHIKDSKKGTFTAAASKHGMGVQEFASKVLANKDNYSPAMVRKANFARNSSKWHGEGGNLFEEAGQMQIGRPFWQSQTQEPSFMESLAEFNRQQELKKQQQRQALREKIDTVGRKLAEERTREDSVESNDNAWVEIPLTYKKKNPHWSRRAEKGAKAHAAWEKEHPNLTAWGNVTGALPFAIAAVPFGAGAVAGSDALAATTAGQAITAGLAPLHQVATSATIAGAPALAWADAGLTSAFGAHGLLQAVEDGGISPMTALETAPLYRPFTVVGKTGVTKAVPVVESFVENHPALYQYPRYIKGKFKYGFDAELPTLYRKMEPGVIPAIDGKGIMSFTNNPSRFRYTATGEDPLITNFSTDVPVRSHSSHWEPDDVFAFSGKSLLGHKVVSTRPSDTFTVGKEVRVPAKKVTFISGRPDAVEKAQKLGYNIYIDDILKDEAAFAKDSWDAVKGKSFNFSKEWDKYIDYDKAIQNTTRNLFRKPTLRDYKFMDYVFHPRYSSQVEPLSNKNVYFDLQNENIWPEWWKGAISNANTRFLIEDLDNLLYHPATPAEARYRDMMGIELLKDIPNNIRSTWKK